MNVSFFGLHIINIISHFCEQTQEQKPVLTTKKPSSQWEVAGFAPIPQHLPSTNSDAQNHCAPPLTHSWPWCPLTFFCPDKAWYIRWKGDHVQANHLDLPHAFHQRLWFFWYVKEKFITSLTNCDTILDTEMYNNVTPLRPRLLWKVDPNNSLYLTRWHQNSI